MAAASAPGKGLQAVQAFRIETLTPFTYNLSRNIEAQGDQVVRQVLGCEENYLGSDDIAIR